MPVSTDRGSTVPAAPDVPDWMLADPQPARTGATSLGQCADTLRDVAGKVRALLTDTATSLGWESEAADATATRAQQSSSRFESAATAFDQAGAARNALAAQLSRRGADLESLLTQRRRSTDVVGFGPLPVVGPDVPGSELTAFRVQTIDNQIAEHVASLTRLDDDADRAIEEATATLRRL